MPPLDIRTFDSYDAFAREWHTDTLEENDISLEAARQRGLLNEQGTRQLWQLLGLIDDDELILQLPEWLAEEKVGFTDRATPTLFVGRVTSATEKAILFEDSAAAQPLMSIAHRIHSLEDGLSNPDKDDRRRRWLENRLQEERAAFESRDEIVSLSEEWLPKSQIQFAIQRQPKDCSLD